MKITWDRQQQNTAQCLGCVIVYFLIVNNNSNEHVTRVDTMLLLLLLFSCLDIEYSEKFVLVSIDALMHNILSVKRESSKSFF